MNRSFALLLTAFLLPARLDVLAGDAAPIRDGVSFAANDTLACGVESGADATACLDGLKWNCVPFTVRCETAKPDCGDWLLRFPTPFPERAPSLLQTTTSLLRETIKPGLQIANIVQPLAPLML